MSKLLQQVKHSCQIRLLGRQVEESYSFWIKLFLMFHKVREPNVLDSSHMTTFLRYLSTELNSSPSALHQAKAALDFFYRYVLKIEVHQESSEDQRPHRQRGLATISVAETNRILSYLGSKYWIICQLIYASGARLNECVRIKHTDVNLADRTIWLRHSSGLKVRQIHYSPQIDRALQIQMSQSASDKSLMNRSTKRNLSLSHINSEADSNANYLFLSSGSKGKGAEQKTKKSITHMGEWEFAQALHLAASKAGLGKTVRPHMLRNSSMVHLLANGMQSDKIKSRMDLKNDQQLKRCYAVLQAQLLVGSG